MQSTLLLNASYEPIKVIPWQKAVTMCFLGKVEVVDVYEREIRSVTVNLKMPAVVRLLRYVKIHTRRIPLTRLNVLIRDGFSCQYCRRKLSMAESSIDHVVPRSQNGLSTWCNVVSACRSCNGKKGGRTPEQAGMHLACKPHEPEWIQVIRLRFRKNLPPHWRLFLGKDPLEEP